MQSRPTQPVWYLAHPLKPDEEHSLQENLDHVVHLTRLFFESGVYVVAPYHTAMLALDDNDLEHRRMGIEADLVVLAALNRIILVGHKLSEGMRLELDLVMDLKGDWINLVGRTDIEMRSFCYRFANRLISP